MKKLLLMLFLASLSISAISQDGIAFQNITLEEAIAKAKKENKHILIDCYTDWCGPCKKMAAQIFPLKEVGDYINPRFVSLKYDMEKGEGIEIAKKIDVKVFPTFLILDADGKRIHSFTGYKDAATFLEFIKDAFDSDKAIGLLGERFDKGERDPQFLDAYLTELVKGYNKKSTIVAAELFRQMTDDEVITEKYWPVFDQHAAFGSEVEAIFYEKADKFRAKFGEKKINEQLAKKAKSNYYIMVMDTRDRYTEKDVTILEGKINKASIQSPELELWQEAALANIKNTMKPIFDAFDKVDANLTNKEKLEISTHFNNLIGKKGTELEKEQWKKLTSKFK